MKHLQRELPLLFEGGVPNDAGSVLASLFTVSIVWWSCNHLLIGMNGIRYNGLIARLVRLVQYDSYGFVRATSQLSFERPSSVVTVVRLVGTLSLGF